MVAWLCLFSDERKVDLDGDDGFNAKHEQFRWVEAPPTDIELSDADESGSSNEIQISFDQSFDAKKLDGSRDRRDVSTSAFGGVDLGHDHRMGRRVDAASYLSIHEGVARGKAGDGNFKEASQVCPASEPCIAQRRLKPAGSGSDRADGVNGRCGDECDRGFRVIDQPALRFHALSALSRRLDTAAVRHRRI